MQKGRAQTGKVAFNKKGPVVPKKIKDEPKSEDENE